MAAVVPASEIRPYSDHLSRDVRNCPKIRKSYDGGSTDLLKPFNYKDNQNFK